MAVEVFANSPATSVLSGGTTAPAGGTQETWTVLSSVSFPAASSSALPPTQFHVVDTVQPSEVITVVNVSGTTWTVIRGAEGSTPVAHAVGFTVFQVATAGALAQLDDVDWLNVVTMFGADPAGVADSTSAIQNAINALPATGGCVYLPAGTYKVTSILTVTSLYATIRGDGRWATMISFTGTGDCLRMYHADSTGPLVGGGVLDLTIDGLSAGAGSTGLHYGDRNVGELRLAVQNFSRAGSMGIHFDNQYAWTEECHGYLWLSNNTQNLVFDVSNIAGTTIAAGSNGGTISGIASWSSPSAGVLAVASTTGYPPTGTLNVAASGATTAVVTYTGLTSNTFTGCAYVSGSPVGTVSTGGTVTLATSTNSFGYSDFAVEILGKQNQDGVVLQNGAAPYNSRFTIKGNFQGTPGANTSAVLRITGQIAAGHTGGFSSLKSSRLDIMAECTSATGSNAPQTIAFGTLSSNALLGCTGIMDFAAGSLAFAVSNWTATGATGFIYDGVIHGDFNLNNSTVGLGSTYSMACSGVRTFSKGLLSAVNGNTQVDVGDFFRTTLTQSITINLNPGGSATLAGAQRKTIILTQAASGGPFTVTWPVTGSPTTSSPTVVWPGGFIPVMSPTAGATDAYLLETYDGATWYGNALQQDSSRDYFYSQNPASGETVIPRLNVGTGATLVSQSMALSYWTAIKTETVNNIIGNTNSVAAGATPTYCAMGVYSVAANGNLTLLGQCANDTTLFASTFTAYTRAVTTPFTKIAGQRYAFAFLVVSAAAMPNLFGYNGTTLLASTAPRITGVVTGQSTLPASVTAGSVSGASAMYFGAVTP